MATATIVAAPTPSCLAAAVAMEVSKRSRKASSLTCIAQFIAALGSILAHCALIWQSKLSRSSLARRLTALPMALRGSIRADSYARSRAAASLVSPGGKSVSHCFAAGRSMLAQAMTTCSIAARCEEASAIRNASAAAASGALSAQRRMSSCRAWSAAGPDSAKHWNVKGISFAGSESTKCSIASFFSSDSATDLISRRSSAAKELPSSAAGNSPDNSWADGRSASLLPGLLPGYKSDDFVLCPTESRGSDRDHTKNATDTASGIKLKTSTFFIRSRGKTQRQDLDNGRMLYGTTLTPLNVEKFKLLEEPEAIARPIYMFVA